MTEIVTHADDVTGFVKCPGCDEELGEANLSVAQSRSYAQSAKIAGGNGGVWLFADVKCNECGERFEVGGQAGLTALPEDV